tara:strand:- start:370 stop:1206 length:837 start_codon:yes stop_codon:yes gene_type:complete
MTKKIWFTWFQGYELAPRIVKDCYQSWVARNPDWEVVFLDNDSYKNYVTLPPDIPFSRLRIQAKSDILRLHLLNQQGGVWVDATTFCTLSLNAWLPDASPSGFFAFHRDHSQQIIPIWFIYADEENTIMNIWQKTADRFLLQGPTVPIFMSRIYHKLYHVFLGKLFPEKMFQLLWINKRFFGLYPYAWPTYLFTYLYRQNTLFRQELDAVPALPYEGPSWLWEVGIDRELSDEIKKQIDEYKFGFHKLKWNHHKDIYQGDTVYSYLVSKYLSEVSTLS